jgi:hypothetical protein
MLSAVSHRGQGLPRTMIWFNRNHRPSGSRYHHCCPGIQCPGESRKRSVACVSLRSDLFRNGDSHAMVGWGEMFCTRSGSCDPRRARSTGRSRSRALICRDCPRGLASFRNCHAVPASHMVPSGDCPPARPRISRRRHPVRRKSHGVRSADKECACRGWFG